VFNKPGNNGTGLQSTLIGLGECVPFLLSSNANDACDYLLNETFTFGLSCFPSQIMNSIGAFSGDRVKDTRQEKIVYQFTT
jgi:hypothetical protein